MEIKIFKIKKSFKKGGLHTNPDVFWNILQGMALIIAISSFIFGFLFFRRINKEFISSSDDITNQATTISKNRIDKVLEYYSGRESKSNNILNSPSPIVDPSL